MSSISHLSSLKEKHAELEHKINEELQRPQPDEIRIKALKQQKLRVKEELSQGTAA